MDKRKIFRVGIIGCGDIFSSHVQAYPDHPDVVIVGFYDRIRSRAEAWFERITQLMNLVREGAESGTEQSDKRDLERCDIFFKETQVFEKVNELLDQVDIIDICTPNYAHAPYAIWALNRNISVMCEKPPARCSLETQWIINNVRKSKAYYQLNENMFFQIYIRELNAIVLAGKLGLVEKITCSLGHSGPSWGWNNHFLNPSLSGGGAMSDMGIHAIGMGFGIIGPDYKVEKIQTKRMKCGTMPERNLIDSNGENEYLIRRFMVEDDAEVWTWLKNSSGHEILFIIEVSWAKNIQQIIIEGTDAKCTLEFDNLKRMNIAIYPLSMEKENITIPGQGRDSHQLECIDFFNRINKNERSYVNEEWAHEMQTIISGSYLSNLYTYIQKKEEGIIITPKDLDDFYQEFINIGCPEQILIDEIVYRLMSPFTNGYFKADELEKKINTQFK